jgi:sterol desaturase/sphingolipid hydroxylase (fatty acid hydroxylase superfamily)
MLIPIILLGIFLFSLERIIPAKKLPTVKGWWKRVVVINILQLSIVILGKMTWDHWFDGANIRYLQGVHPIVGGVVAYFVVTFVFYWWHRVRHDVNVLWLAFHQIHHSPQRIETITSFYKHPLEIMVNSLIIGVVNFMIVGVDVEAAAWCLFFSSAGEFFYHMNISTPRWIGFFFQRPEMHHIHHQFNRHYYNFSDIPLWDMLFGTYINPKKEPVTCGFRPERESQFLKMLLFKNVNNRFPK